MKKKEIELMNIDNDNEYKSNKLYKNKSNKNITFSDAVDSKKFKKKKVDEISEYRNCRWISPCESMWRIFAFETNGRYPNVVSLPICLPNDFKLRNIGPNNHGTFDELKTLQRIKKKIK